MSRLIAASVALALVAPAPDTAAQQVDAAPTVPTLELAMADLDWIGSAPLNPYWSDDGERIYFERERPGSSVRDTYVIARDGSEWLVPDHEQHLVDTRRGDLDADRSHKICTRHGDLFLKDLATGIETQLTRTPSTESWPQFLLGDDRIAFRRGDDVFVRDLATGVEEQIAGFSSSDPERDDAGEDRSTPSFLEAQQERLFEIVRERDRRGDEARERREAREAADPTRTPDPIRVGSGRRVGRFALAPTGTHVLLSLVSTSGASGKRDTMPEWIDASGYASSRSVRPLVGTSGRAASAIGIVDLRTGALHELDLSTLPEIGVDRLAAIREESTELAARWTPAGIEPAPEPEAPDGDDDGPTDDDDDDAEPRGVSVLDLRWSRDGRYASVMLRSLDNKDRWIAVVDAQDDGEEAYDLRVVHHLHDPAWVNWSFNEIGFLPDSRQLWFLGEQTGSSHLYAVDLAGDGDVRPLTAGDFEVMSVQVSRDGSTAYVIANREHPGVLELYAVPTDNDARVTPDAFTRITTMGGHSQAFISPDETQVLVRHDSELRPPELYLQDLAPGAMAVQLTASTTPAFDAVEWTPPEHVTVPSTQADRPIHARLYLPPEGVDRTRGPDGRRAAVIFTHGAGYLQNAHKGWSDYVHEFMFHSVLARAGYVVLDPDYRASAGYGRDWRTAIYRHMGEPEIVDLRDCVDYLVAEHGVDRERVGTYGGSYGGFLTLISLFRAPDLFACGAALRPVTDWAHYNDWYTANILNTPGDDPLAYLRSSPIEHAEGLAAPLLMCHGMLDDNVFFKDTVRLAQRLIELGKTDWEVAIYPVEPHSFTEASSWLDEYRRILALFEEHLLPSSSPASSGAPLGTGRPLAPR